MKMKILAALAGVATAAAVTGCVSTVSGTRTAAVPFQRDSVSGRYQRTLPEVYAAAKTVLQRDGVLQTEFIPHDTTNTVRSVFGKVNQRDVWIRVEQVNPQITQVTVEARTKWGAGDIDLTHELEKEIALQLIQ
ncbi:MAG: DUF3568 family protein [Verrucomicrobiota bacterium]|nr:DUF3568 family protein [Verrucomicrobiota bacterium]